MTTDSAVPEVLHVWAIYMRASEEARRRGDRRTGTDHILLGLLEDPSIEVVLGVSLQQARQALESLDQEARLAGQTRRQRRIRACGTRDPQAAVSTPIPTRRHAVTHRQSLPVGNGRPRPEGGGGIA